MTQGALSGGGSGSHVEGHHQTVHLKVTYVHIGKDSKPF